MGAQAFTVYDMMARSAALYRDAPALIQGPGQWSFRQLLERADALAAGLTGLGLSKGDRICILAQNDAAYVDLYGACARQGIIAYPINWRLTAQEVERVLERAAPTMMVADASTLPVVGEWPRTQRGVAHWYQLGEAPPAAGFTALSSLYRDDPPPAADVTGDDPFAVISTAAVDVIPRGAVLTHSNVVTASLVVVQALGFTAADRYLLALPLFHITALGNLLAHLHAGGACVLVARYDAEEAVRLIDAHRITHVSDFPPVLVNLLDAAQKLGSKLPSLTHVSGLDAPPTIQRLHDETQAQFWTGFGQSETTGFVSIQRVGDKPGAAGRPIALCRLRLVADCEGEAIKAIVEVRPPDRYSAQQVVDFVGSKIARFKRPHAVAFTDALPRTADGAVDREAVKSRWGTGA